MAVVEQQVSCPNCDAVLEVTVDDRKTVLEARDGHSETEGTLNQVCTECVSGFHVVFA